MADNVDDEVEDVEEEQLKSSKHDKEAADLERVTDYHGDKEDMKVTSSALGNLMSDGVAPKKKTVSVKKEDVEWMVRELDLPRYRVERKLIEHDGNVKAAVRDLIGF